MNKFKNIDLTKRKNISFNPIEATPKQEAQEFKKVDRPLLINEQLFIDQDIKLWRSTIKNNKQLQELIKVRYEEQTSQEWTVKHVKYFINMINRVT
jgi:hypothetical protein